MQQSNLSILWSSATGHQQSCRGITMGQIQLAGEAVGYTTTCLALKQVLASGSEPCLKAPRHAHRSQMQPVSWQPQFLQLRLSSGNGGGLLNLRSLMTGLCASRPHPPNHTLACRASRLEVGSTIREALSRLPRVHLPLQAGL